MKSFKIIGFFTLFTISLCNGSSLNQSELGEDVTALQEHIIDFLGPFKVPIRKWFWEISGVTYNVPVGLQQGRADYITCEICTPALPLVRDLLDAGISTDVIIGVLNVACQVLELAPDPSICLPTIQSYAISILYIVKNRPDLPDADFCGIINTNCGEISEKLKNWKIRINSEKPLPRPRPPPPPENQALTKIVQFTDIHLDLDYKEGTNADCPLPICCRQGVPSNDDNTAGKYGHYKCGLPLTAMEAMYFEAGTTHSDASFVFLTGDYVHSGIWLYSAVENGRHIRRVAESLRASFPETTEIFPLVGNHEPDVVNMYPPESTWNDFSLAWMYHSLSDPMGDFLPPHQLSLFRKYGYYTVVTKADPKLRIIALNTNICYINNFWLPYDAIDTNGQLQWFADTLNLAEKLGEKVFVLGHIHPGSGSCWTVWSNQFQRVINRYESIIRGQWYGHSHEQDYKLTFEEETARPISTSFVGGSGVTDGMNSGFNVYYADGERGAESSWEIINHETYILDLAASNSLPDDAISPIFKKILNARQDFGIKSLAPEEIHDFMYRMVCDDDLFLTYQKVVVKGTFDTTRWRPCGNDTQCKAGVLGDLFKSNSGDRSHQQKFEEYILNVDCNEIPDNGGPGSLQASMILSIGWILLNYVVKSYLV